MSTFNMVLITIIYSLTAFINSYMSGKVLAVDKNLNKFGISLVIGFVPVLNFMFMCLNLAGFLYLYAGPIDSCVAKKPMHDFLKNE